MGKYPCKKYEKLSLLQYERNKLEEKKQVCNHKLKEKILYWVSCNDGKLNMGPCRL